MWGTNSFENLFTCMDNECPVFHQECNGNHIACESVEKIFAESDFGKHMQPPNKHDVLNMKEIQDILRGEKAE